VTRIELAAFEANAGTVLVRHTGTAKLNVFDTNITVADDPDGLVFGALAVGD
jgi:hypothetical protein